MVKSNENKNNSSERELIEAKGQRKVILHEQSLGRVYNER